MTVARASSAETERVGTEDPYTFDFTPVGTPRGIAIGLVQQASATPFVTSISYGGVPLGFVIRATDTLIEPGVAEFWFLGSGVPPGLQTVSVDLTSAVGNDMFFVVWELSGNVDLEVIDSDGLSEDAANPTVTLQSGGREKISLCIMHGGAAGPGGTLAPGNTLDFTQDMGASMAQSCFETTVDNADHTIGWSTLTLDDLALVAIAVSETQTVTGTVGSTQAPQPMATSGTVTNPVPPFVPGGNRMGGTGSIRKPPRS